MANLHNLRAILEGDLRAKWHAARGRLNTSPLSFVKTSSSRVFA